MSSFICFFFFQAEDGIRDLTVTGVQTCALPIWDPLSPQHKKLYARMMEVFAGFLTHTDYHIGRLLDYLKSIGAFDNTLIMVISDNGASAEGGPTGTSNEGQFFNNAPEPFEESLKAIDKLGGPETYNHYAWGWTWAGNTPFRRWKRETYRGGVSDPFIVHWPRGIQAKGEIRTQYAHAIDMVPTVLDALGIQPAAVIKGVTHSPIQGVSFAQSFNDANAPTRHVTQYFEMFGHRSLYHDGWRAVCPWPGPSFAEASNPFGTPISAETLAELDARGGELYHVAEDIAENHNVATDNRERVINMIATWYVEAGQYKVLPGDGSLLQRPRPEGPQPPDAPTSHPSSQRTPTV